MVVSVRTGAEGKAGMAAIADPSHSTDLEKFVKDMEKALPPYARPVFLRFLREVNKTGKVLFFLMPFYVKESIKKDFQKLTVLFLCNLGEKITVDF